MHGTLSPHQYRVRGGGGGGWRGVHFTGRLLHMGERVTIMDFLGGLQYQFLDQLANAGPKSLKVN